MLSNNKRKKWSIESKQFRSQFKTILLQVLTLSLVFDNILCKLRRKRFNST